MNIRKLICKIKTHKPKVFEYKTIWGMLSLIRCKRCKEIYNVPMNANSVEGKAYFKAWGMK